MPISVQELVMRHWWNTCSITLTNTSSLPQHVLHAAFGVCIYTWTCHITSILISFTSSDFLPNFSLSPIQPTSLFTFTFIFFPTFSFLLIVLSESKNLTAAYKNKNKTPCLPPPFSFSGRTEYTPLFIQTCLSLGDIVLVRITSSFCLMRCQKNRETDRKGSLKCKEGRIKKGKYRLYIFIPFCIKCELFH